MSLVFVQFKPAEGWQIFVLGKAISYVRAGYLDSVSSSSPRLLFL